MRDIKFRAWDKEEKEMYLWEADKLAERSIFEADWEMPSLFDEILWGSHPEMILMQYTGLKDKNGKEIYEGDIVKDQAGDNWEVYFDLGQFLLKNKILLDTPISLYQEPVVEVIGNIYENPELI